MEFTVRKKKQNRLAIRGVGVVFTIIGLYVGVKNVLLQTDRMSVLSVAIMCMCLVVGITYVKNSFVKGAYDITYKVKPDALYVCHHRGELKVPYDSVKEVSIHKVDESMDYYLLRISTSQEKYVLHILGQEEKANGMYQLLQQYTNLSD